MVDISIIFDTLKPTYAVNAAIELYGSFMIVIAIAMASFMQLEKGLFRYFVFAGIFTILTAASDAVASILRGMPGEAARWTLLVSNFYAIIGPFCCSVFYSSILFYTYKDVGNKTYRTFMTISCAYGVAVIAVLIGLQLAGLLYTIDENNLYSRGPLFFLSAIFIAPSILLAIVYMVIRRRQSQTKISLHAALYIAIPVVGIILQLVFYGCVFLPTSLFILMVIILWRIQTVNSRRIIEQTATIAKNEIELTQAHEKLLLSQVQPHFIYNTLFAIRSIEGNPEKTVEAITEFSDYIRANLSVLDGKNLVPFEEEMGYVKDYVALQQLRFGDRVTVQYDVQDADFSIPPLTVQIVVENAIKHGISVSCESGTIVVSSHKEGNYHVIKVTDDGVGFDTNKLKNTDRVGLRSIRNRLEYFLDGTLSIESTIGEGTEVTIRIPNKKSRFLNINRPF